MAGREVGPKADDDVAAFEVEHERVEFFGHGHLRISGSGAA
jgi:hypothetical protein